MSAVATGAGANRGGSGAAAAAGSTTSPSEAARNYRQREYMMSELHARLGGGRIKQAGGSGVSGGGSPRSTSTARCDHAAY